MLIQKFEVEGEIEDLVTKLLSKNEFGAALKTFSMI